MSTEPICIGVPGRRTLAEDQTAGAVEARGVSAGEPCDGDARAGVRGVDEPAGADVETDVTNAVEEDEVAGP